MDFNNLFSLFGSDPRNYYNNYQNLQGQIDQWVAQAKEQAGQLGLDNSGGNAQSLLYGSAIPQTPPREIFLRLAEMEEQQKNNMLRGLSDFNNQCIAHKEKVFATWHYEFDENGNPVLDENGNPALYQGAESPNQTRMRSAWETQRKDTLRKQHDAELETYVYNTVAETQRLMAELRQTKDPERIKQIYQRLEQLSNGEIELRAHIYMEDLKVGMEGLPDMLEGGSLLDFVDRRAQALRQSFESNAQEVANSPEAQMIKAYQEKMAAYAASLQGQYGYGNS